MKRSLLAAVLLAATATTALAASVNSMVVLRTAGYWTAYYDPSNSGGKPMCGLMSRMEYKSGALGSFMVKYSKGDALFVHLYKSSWSIPEGTEIPVWLQLDTYGPLTATADGGRRSEQDNQRQLCRILHQG
jgi:opacity protein-like surface antigen